eukprot:CAMPEP_0174322540 /NCGR_PEP_ID=MMETSP0810-20121108/11059_1 /TAXON_ID=73025 ORGANISM="Eutreptiella gymnastica-like, Strain CCMP1594" /NCGR_SAMPLE_ID=MMETSP0810 /ASSEMBLY_ACC=CAM_ASM_000659 /LENGTH=153 /DNA_ID=CAMNT_0015434369 /DNA_START=62 /DNA_END=523 /DNA_ORIENTATION=+
MCAFHHMDAQVVSVQTGHTAQLQHTPCSMPHASYVVQYHMHKCPWTSMRTAPTSQTTSNQALSLLRFTVCPSLHCAGAQCCKTTSIRIRLWYERLQLELDGVQRLHNGIHALGKPERHLIGMQLPGLAPNGKMLTIVLQQMILTPFLFAIDDR